MKSSIIRLRSWILKGLLADRDFRLMWLSSTLTSFGSQITLLALPLTAVVLLNATPKQMGTMAALEAIPFSLLSLQAGVLIDRLKKLPILVWGGLFVGITLAAIPALQFAHLLSMHVLYMVGFTLGMAFVVVGTAAQVFLTHLAGRERLIEANSLFTASDSAARLTGPGVAGILIQVLGAPFAIIADCCGFIASVILLHRIGFDEVVPRTAGQMAMWREIKAGLALVKRDPILRTLTFCATGWILLFQGFLTLDTLFASRHLGLSPGQIGIAHMLGGGGAMLAALGARPLTRRFGMGAPILMGIGCSGVSWLLISLLEPNAYAFALLGVCLFLLDLGVTTYWINYSTLRQSVTPDALLGRMTATMRFFSVAPAPLGAYFAGWMGETVGLRATLASLGLGALLLGLVALAMTNLRRVPDLTQGSRADLAELA